MSNVIEFPKQPELIRPIPTEDEEEGVLWVSLEQVADLAEASIEVALKMLIEKETLGQCRLVGVDPYVWEIKIREERNK